MEYQTGEECLNTDELSFALLAEKVINLFKFIKDKENEYQIIKNMFKTIRVLYNSDNSNVKNASKEARITQATEVTPRLKFKGQ